MIKYFDVRSGASHESCTRQGLARALERVALISPNKVISYEVRPLKSNGRLYKRAEVMRVEVDAMAVESGGKSWFNVLVVGDTSVSRAIVAALAGTRANVNVI